MKKSQTYYTRASIAALIFVMIGYTIKFYPEQLAGFDVAIQSAFRGNLPQIASWFWSNITVLGEVLPIVGMIAFLSIFFYWKKWQAETLFLLIGMAVMAGASTALKFLYQRPRPSLEWVVETVGYSFPSWHTASTMMLAGILCIILYQRMSHRFLCLLVQGLLLVTAILVALSRIYVGVHYPTDIIGGWLLAYLLLNLLYPTYDRQRFIWRFQQKQK